MNFTTCQYCNTNKLYIRCEECELTLCTYCDSSIHLQIQSQGQKDHSSFQNKGIHKRIRICEECEESECAIHCLNCEQFLCYSCNSRLHKKGARQKHKRQTVSGQPEMIQLAQNERSKSITGQSTTTKEKNSNSQQRLHGGESESSRKDSNENDYLEENQNSQDDSYQQYSSSYKTVKDRKKGVGMKTESVSTGGDYKVSRQVASNYYMQTGKQGKTSNYKETKGSNYSSGGSSAGSYKNSYQGNYKQDHYYNQYIGTSSGGNKGGLPSKYKKSPSYYGESYGNTHDKNSSLNTESIPSQYLEGEQVFIPIFQPYIKYHEFSEQMIEIQKELFNFARKGDLLIDYNIFKDCLIKRLNMHDSQVQDLIEKAEELGIIHQTKRNFASMKTLSFVSLQLDIISHECLLWVLISLKNDEMTPTERAVQSRIKEAFAFKISAPLWDCMMESVSQNSKKISNEVAQNLNSNNTIQNQNNSSGGQQQQIYQRQVKYNTNQMKVVTVRECIKSKQKSYNEYYKSSISSSYSYNTRNQYIYLEKHKQQESNFEFTIKEIEEDPSIGQMTKVLYIKSEEEWVGVDQTTDDIDYELYDRLKNFLHNYFCQPLETQEEEEKWFSSIENGLTKKDVVNNVTLNKVGSNQNQMSQVNSGTHTYSDVDFEEVRAIPGGRYGCAQFVKICGPQNLKDQSLGKLAQLVQYAIKEDVLRYHKTLLVWTTTVDKHKKMAEEMQKESQKNATVAAKLNVVKDALIEILAESKTGMSLAQLPLYLRRKLPFALDLNELGFPKLKDLILSMSDKIKLELRGHNHPFAYLISGQRYQHSKLNSDDFQSIPKNKGFIKSNQHHLSEDVNINRHLNNALALNESKIKIVLTAFYNLMREKPLGTTSEEISHLLSQKIGFEFNYKDFLCNSLFEFLKKYVMPTIDIEIVSNTSNENDVFLIRSKKFFMNYNVEVQQQQNVSSFQKVMPTASDSGNTNVSTQNSNNNLIQQQLLLNENLKQRNDSIGSMNFSTNNYVPNAQSLYGGSNSVNTSTQINISHIRFNTGDNSELSQLNNTQTQQQYLIAQQAQFPQQKLPPNLYLEKANINIHPNSLVGGGTSSGMINNYINPQLQQAAYAQSMKTSGTYRTYPPTISAPQYIRHQQSVSNTTNQSMQSVGFSQIPFQKGGNTGFYLSPSQVVNKIEESTGMMNSPTNHNRAISFNQSVLGGAVGVHSTTSKSASQDFSIQSQFLQNQALKQNQFISGFATPQMPPFNQWGYPNMNNFGKQGQFFSNIQGDSMFGSPIPRSQQYETSSLQHTSPPYDQDEDNNQDHNIKFIEKLVCEDDLDFRSNIDEQSSISLHSPEFQTTALRIPNSQLMHSNFQNAPLPSTFIAGGMNPMNMNLKQGGNTMNQVVVGGANKQKTWSADFMKQTSNPQLGASKGILSSSNSCKTITGPILEGGSSSSEENKRHSIVQEQKTEEDADDNSNNGENTGKNTLNDQMQQENTEGDCLWSNDVKLF